MASSKKSSRFTTPQAGSFGAPLIGALLRLPWETVRRRMLERLHERGFGDIDAPHLNLLLFPGPDGLKPTELAARMSASKQSVNHLLGQLERFGYIERRDDPHDRRSKRIRLTPRGRTVAITIREAVTQVEREWALLIGPKRLELLREILRELSEASASR
jgi:DNA-binding MarR family transcriptional regulator